MPSRSARLRWFLLISLVLVAGSASVLAATKADVRLSGLAWALKNRISRMLEPPARFGGPPYPESRVIASIVFDDESIRTAAPGSDNWPVAWAANDVLFTSWGDGGGFGGGNEEGRVSLGIARVEGDRSSYTGTNIAGGVGAQHPAPFTGKSVGILAIEDTLYLWRNGDSSERSAFKFSQLYRSDDLGASWHFTGVEFSRRAGDFSGEDEGFFSPTFCQFGRGNAGGREGYVYVYAPEIIDRSHWGIQRPGRVALLRVPTESIATKSAYEFFAGLEAGSPRWTTEVSERAPVWEDSINGAHRMAVSHNPGLDRFFLTSMTVERAGWLAVYDAADPWGPWSTVLVEKNTKRWGSKVVVFNFVNKWLRNGGKEFVLVYTKNDSWATIEGQFQLRAESDTP